MRVLFWIVALATAAAATVFAISNSAPVRLDFWPLGLSLEGPVYAIAFASAGVGFAVGAVVASLTAVRARWAARDAARNAAAAERELARLREPGVQPPPLPVLPGPV